MNILTEFITRRLDVKYKLHDTQYGDLLIIGYRPFLVSENSLIINDTLETSRILGGMCEILHYHTDGGLVDAAASLIHSAAPIISIDLCDPATTEDKINDVVNRCVVEIDLLVKGYDMKLAALFEWLNVKRDTELCTQMLKLSASIVGVIHQPSGDFVRSTLIEMGRLMKRVKIDEPDTNGKQAALVGRLNRRIQEVYNGPKQFIDFKTEFLDFIENMGLKLGK